MKRKCKKGEQKREWEKRMLEERGRKGCVGCRSPFISSQLATFWPSHGPVGETLADRLTFISLRDICKNDGLEL